MSALRTRWAAVGAAVAITLGAGGTLSVVDATVSSGTRTVFVPITPCRIIDTRPAFQVGPKSSPLGPAEVFDVDGHGMSGECTIPGDAAGLSLNVTTVAATLPTFVTVWATGATRPNASNLNPTPGAPPTPNAVTTELSSGGEFSIYNLQGSVHVFADVNGYYADHDHDDRYDTSAEVDTKIETASEVVSASSGPGPSYVPQFSPNLTQDFTTTQPGTLHITGVFGISYDCNSGAAWYYLMLDGEPLETSAVLRSDTELSPRTYIGVTGDIMPAGTYTLSMSAECDGAPGSSGSGSRSYRAVSVIVVP